MTIIPADKYREAHDRIYGPYGAEIEWKDRDGKVWKVTEMADDHLENSMAMMIRNAVGIHDRECYRMAEAGDDPIIGPSGDAANDAFDDGFRQLMDMDPEEYIKTSYPPYLAMKAVLDHRQKLMDERVKDSQRIADWIDEEVAEEDAKRAFIAKYLHDDDDVFCGCHQPSVETLIDEIGKAEAAWVESTNE